MDDGDDNPLSLVVWVFFGFFVLVGGAFDALTGTNFRGRQPLTPEQRRRRFTNRLGIFILMVLVGVIGYSYVAKRIEEKRKVERAFEQTQRVADAFANNDREAIMKWARGEEKDPWGNQIRLLENGSFVLMNSTGPDGVFATDPSRTPEEQLAKFDDINSAPTEVVGRRYMFTGHEKGLIQKAADKAYVAKLKYDAAKETVRGWKIPFFGKGEE